MTYLESFYWLLANGWKLEDSRRGEWSKGNRMVSISEQEPVSLRETIFMQHDSFSEWAKAEELDELVIASARKLIEGNTT